MYIKAIQTFNSLTDSHIPSVAFYPVANLKSFNSLTDSHTEGLKDLKERIETFNSLTDSHIKAEVFSAKLANNLSIP